MTDYGATDTSTTSLSANQFPLSAAYVPNDALRPVGGGPKQTDSGNKAYTSVLVYVQDGYDVTQGTSTDAANANTIIGQLKQIRLNTASVTIGGGTVAATQSGAWVVTANAGTNLNTSALALDTSVNGVIVSQGSTTSGEKGPLVQGAVTTSAPTYTTAQTSPISLTTAGAVRTDASATTQPVSGTFWQATQPISAASLPLPTGASTAAKQPALGTAGSASADVITIQGIASMTAVKTDGSGVTQPVSGTITANIGTVNGLALDATVAKLNVAQGTALGSNTGPMLQGSVTTGSPTYATGNINPISLTTAGAVRVDASATTQPISGTVTANQGGAPWAENITQIGGSPLALGQAAMASSLPVTIASNQGAIGSAVIQAVAGTALAADQTNSELRVSNYVKTTTAGDTALTLGQATMANSLPVVIASNQGAIGSVTVQAVAGTALAADQGNTELRSSLYGKNSTAGDTALKVNSSGDQYILGDFTEQASLSAGSLNADLVASTDVSAYKGFSCHINSNAYSGTLTVQVSDDNTNWVSYTVPRVDSSVISSTYNQTNVMFYGSIVARYLRIRMTSYASGTAQGTLELYTSPFSPLSISPGSGGATIGNVFAIPNSSGGTVDYHLISAATTNANNVKASAGQVYGYDLGNSGASDAWVKLYNTSGTPTAGSGTPFRTIYVPKGGRASFHSSTGLAMGTGIGLTITGGAADSDTTAVALSQVTVEIDYK